jgi:hypothetical protein
MVVLTLSSGHGLLLILTVLRLLLVLLISLLLLGAGRACGDGLVPLQPCIFVSLG